jgi:hypothetical protein
MKDHTDKKTLDILGEKRRGRPSTGSALSVAERKRKQREKEKAQGVRLVSLNQEERQLLSDSLKMAAHWLEQTGEDHPHWLGQAALIQEKLA